MVRTENLGVRTEGRKQLYEWKQIFITAIATAVATIIGVIMAMAIIVSPAKSRIVQKLRKTSIC